MYYARAIDCTILPALNTSATQQAAPTENTLHICHRLLNYAATYPSVHLHYYANNMTLHIHSDAAYLVAPKVRSRITWYFSLVSPSSSSPIPAGPILIECKTLRNVVASSAEVKVAGILHNAQVAIPICHILQLLGHPQPPTPIKTDHNTTVLSFSEKNITPKCSKSWDMCYYWLRDKQEMKQFKLSWERALQNLADYFTKHFSAMHHKHIRFKYVFDDTDVLRPARVC